MIRPLALLALLLPAPLRAEPPPAPVAATAPEKAAERIGTEALATRLAAPDERVRVVVFWASWCGPCIREMPMLRDYAQSHAEVRLVFVNVDAPAMQPRRVPTIVAQKGLEAFDHWWLDASDPNRAMREAFAWWPERIPVVRVLDRHGGVVENFVEAVSAPKLDAAVRHADAAVPPG